MNAGMLVPNLPRGGPRTKKRQLLPLQASLIIHKTVIFFEKVPIKMGKTPFEVANPVIT